MKQTKSYLLILLIILSIIALIQVMAPTIGTTLVSILTTLTTIVGVFSVFFEMKRSADLAECDFIFGLHKHFEESDRIQEIYMKLDHEYITGECTIDDSDHQNIISYLSFYEMLCNLIVKGALAIEDIDALFSYTFFVGVNNKKFQDIELKKYADYYQNIYTIYRKWYSYRMKKGREIPFKDNKLLWFFVK